MERFYGDFDNLERYDTADDEDTGRLLSEAECMPVIRLLATDVVATLGAEHEPLVMPNAENQREFAHDVDDFAQLLVDHVQQDVHDQFIDTTWPACPRHRRHPLWYRDGAWWCEADGAAIARLGELARDRELP